MEKYEDFLYRIGSGSSQEEFSDLLVTYSFAKEVRNGNKSYENEDLKDGRSLDRYNKFIKFVTARNPKNYLMNDFATANQDYVFEMAAIIINKILGDNKQLMEEFMEFMSYIKVRESEEVLNGISYKMLNDLNGDIIYNVLLPSITNISSIVCIIHEFIHFHFQKNNMEPKKFYYGEILTSDVCADLDGRNFTVVESFKYSWITEYHIECKSFEIGNIGSFAFIGNAAGGFVFSFISKLISHKKILIISSFGFSIAIFLATLVS